MERTAPKAIRKPKVIGNINEIKRPTITGKIKTPTLEIMINVKDPINPVTLNYVLRRTSLAALRKIKKKDEEL